MKQVSRKGLLHSALLLRLQQLQQQAQLISALRTKRQEVFTALAAERARQEMFSQSYAGAQGRGRYTQRSLANIRSFAASVDAMLDEIDGAIVRQCGELRQIDEELNSHQHALSSLEAQRAQLKKQLALEYKKERAAAEAGEAIDAGELALMRRPAVEH